MNIPGAYGRHFCPAEIEGFDAAGRPAQATVPLVVVNGKNDGPALLVTGGVHGDEYEGPAAIWHVAREIDPETLRGRVLFVSQLNPPAIQARQRCSPLDELDLNRCFPGETGGVLSYGIANFVASELVPIADVVIDLHAGGSDDEMIPSLMVHHYDDQSLMKGAIELLAAFGAPVGVVIDEDSKQGMFDTYVEAQGKLFGCAELGGAGRLTPETLDISKRGIWNVLAHLDMAKQPEWMISQQQKHRAGLFFGPAHGEAATPISGFYEPIRAVGEKVLKGDVFGLIQNHASPLEDPIEVTAPADGMLFVNCVGGHVHSGDGLGQVIVEARDADHLYDISNQYVSALAKPSDQ